MRNPDYHPFSCAGEEDAVCVKYILAIVSAVRFAPALTGEAPVTPVTALGINCEIAGPAQTHPVKFQALAFVLGSGDFELIRGANV